MTYAVQITHLVPDMYGFLKRRASSVFIDAASKRDARRLARETCIIRELRRPHIGPACRKKG